MSRYNFHLVFLLKFEKRMQYLFVSLGLWQFSLPLSLFLLVILLFIIRDSCLNNFRSFVHSDMLSKATKVFFGCHLFIAFVFYLVNNGITTKKKKLGVSFLIASSLCVPWFFRTWEKRKNYFLISFLNCIFFFFTIYLATETFTVTTINELLSL